MRLLWQSPVVLWGLALLLVPLAIHLLLRPVMQRVAFPSLRFLPASRLASARRRVVDDWPLLMVRMAMLALAVAALAGPVLVTPARERTWADRVVRAIVVDAGVGPGGAQAEPVVDALVDEARSGAVAVTRIDSHRLMDGLIEAAAWLDRAPPAARELVLISDFREGSIGRRDLGALAPGVGVRLVPLPARARAVPEVRRVARDGDHRVERRYRLELHDEGTAVSEVAGLDEVALRVEVEAGSDERRLLDAALDAVLEEGLFVDGDPVPVVLVWGPEGERARDDVRVPESPAVRHALDRFAATAGPAPAGGFDTAEGPWVPVWPGRLFAGEQNDHLVILGRGDLSVDDALRVARAALRATYSAPSFERFEPRTLGMDARAAIARPAAPADTDAVARAGGNDARWAWALVLVLMGVEQWMRRPRKRDAVATRGPDLEARVA